jgi:hypothetical protein
MDVEQLIMDLAVDCHHGLARDHPRLGRFFCCIIAD